MGERIPSDEEIEGALDNGTVKGCRVLYVEARRARASESALAKENHAKTRALMGRDERIAELERQIAEAREFQCEDCDAPFGGIIDFDTNDPEPKSSGVWFCGHCWNEGITEARAHAAKEATKRAEAAEQRIAELEREVALYREGVEDAAHEARERAEAAESKLREVERELDDWRKATGFSDPDLLGAFLSRETVPEWTARVGRVEAERRAELERQVEARREALASLSKRVEQDIASKDYRYLPDHACAECVPGGEILIEGFRCGRHGALALLASPPPKPEGGG